MKSFKETFYKSNASKFIWKTYSNEMKMVFKNKLINLDLLLNSPLYDDEYRETQWMTMRRLEWGYNIFNSQLPTKSGLCSKKCYDYIKNRKSTKLVKDHFYGVTEAANEVRRNFEESNFNIDYMVNEWLPKNYHLFLTWQVTPEEHKGENIKRAQHSIDEKDRFEHLINVSEVVEKKSRKQII